MSFHFVKVFLIDLSALWCVVDVLGCSSSQLITFITQNKNFRWILILNFLNVVHLLFKLLVNFVSFSDDAYFVACPLYFIFSTNFYWKIWYWFDTYVFWNYWGGFFSYSSQINLFSLRILGYWTWWLFRLLRYNFSNSKWYKRHFLLNYGFEFQLLFCFGEELLLFNAEFWEFADAFDVLAS